MPSAKYLLIINKGPGAAHIARGPSCWDLLEIYFFPSQIQQITDTPSLTDAEHVVFETDRNRKKFMILKSIFEGNDFWKAYDAIMMADDDLIPIGCQIVDMFDLFMQTGCRIGQPALTRDSYWSHEITLRNTKSTWRRTTFAEVMCPIMTPDAITAYLPAFSATASAYGLDNYWSFNEWRSGNGVAILDKTPMRHCRPVGGGIVYQNMGMDSALKEALDFLGKHNIPSEHPHLDLECL